MTAPRLCIATPIDGMPDSAKCAFGYARALAQILSARDTEVQMMPPAALGYPADLVRARSRVVNYAHEVDATHVLWLDDDNVIKPGALASMLASGHDIIGCPYPRKQLHWKRVGRASAFEEPEWHAYNYAYHFAPGDGGQKNVTVTDGCIPVERMGMGCMLTTVRALDAIVDHFREADWFTDVSVEGKSTPCVAIFGLLMSMIYEVDGRPFRALYSEDYSFCERYNVMRDNRPDLGFGPIQMLVSHPADHVGGHLFRGSAEGIAYGR